MKMIIAVVQGKDANMLMDALVEKRLGITKINTSGGFLRESNITLLIGVEDNRVEEVVQIIRTNCHVRNRYINPMPPMSEPGGEFYMPTPVEVPVGGATIFVLQVDKYIRL
jgi:uncharacterized protein YaaQ